MLKFQVVLITLFVITTQAKLPSSSQKSQSLSHDEHNQLISRNAVPQSKSDVYDEFNERNSGPPLDMSNKLKQVQNKQKRPSSQPNSVKHRKGRLVNRSHQILKVADFGVTSTVESEDNGTLMEITTVGKNLVTIRGVEDNNYVCMNRENGQMFARESANDDCIFKEDLEENFHSTFKLNNDASPWFIAINSKGKFMLKNTKKLDFSSYFQLIS